MGQRHRAGRHFPGARARAYCQAEASLLKNIHRRGRTAGTSLHAAALSMARGTSGVWLRAVSRLGLLCRGTVYLLIGYLALRPRPAFCAWLVRKVQLAINDRLQNSGNKLLVTECERSVQDRHRNSAANDG